MVFGSTQPETADNKWRRQLDVFVKENQKELAALAWGLWQENGSSQGTIGINLKPVPHFVYCPQDSIEKLNDNVDNRLQEILGLIKHHKPEIEVLMIAIGKDEVKLIYFESNPAPEECFNQVGKDINTLMDDLERGLSEKVNL